MPPAGEDTPDGGATSEETAGDAPLAPEILREIEQIEAVALELARQAGDEIATAFGRGVTVEYKSEARGDAAPTDPVSEVDRAIEALLRERVAERFPAHAIIGEEDDLQAAPEIDFLWVVDPVDGTTNFVNGFPLFACSIGVLYRGLPVAGAIWCSTGHALRPGVYHARRGAALRFDGELVPPRGNVGVSRRLAAAPGGAAGRSSRWDTRVTGSTAIECAFVSAGIFNSGAFSAPSIWDVAAGVTLAQAAGLRVLTRSRSEWTPFDRFRPPTRVREDRAPTLRDWRQPLLIGEPEAVSERSQQMRGPSLWRRMRRRMWRRR